MARQTGDFALCIRYFVNLQRRLKKIRVQTTHPIDQSLVKKLSDFVAEVTILIDPLQNQISILQNWRQFVQDDLGADGAILELYDRAIIAREVHLGSFQRLLDQGKNTQELVSNHFEARTLCQISCSSLRSCSS